MYQCIDVRIKDGILEPNDSVGGEDNAIIAFNPSHTMQTMDSLSAISPPNPSPATSGNESIGGGGGVPGIGSNNDIENWSNTGQSSWTGSHDWSDRPPNPRQSRNPNQPFECYNCRSYGHMSRECPNPRRDNNTGRGKNNRRRYGTDGDNREPVWSSEPNRHNVKKWSNQMTNTEEIEAKKSEINLFPQLREYYLSQSLSDIRIEIDGQTLFGHKFVVSAKCDVFREMLFREEVTKTDSELEVNKKQMESTLTEDVIRLEDTNVEAFKLMLKFLYFEDLRLIDENAGNYQMAIEVLKLSKRFKIDRLSTLMEKELIEWLEIDNFVDICKLSIDSESKQLSNSLEAFIHRNERLIIEKKSFVNESIEVMTKILESMQNQNAIIDALALIIESNPTLDVSSLKQMIDFKNCSIKDIDVLKRIGLFDEKELFAIVRQKYDELLIEKKFNYN